MKSHIVTIREASKVVGFQLRHDEGTRYFAVRKLGGVSKAETAAKLTATVMGLPLRTYPQRSLDGIRFRWQEGHLASYLYVVVSYRDHLQRLHITGYSTHKHGLVKALNMAIYARESVGNKVTHREALLKALRAEYHSRAK